MRTAMRLPLNKMTAGARVFARFDPNHAEGRALQKEIEARRAARVAEEAEKVEKPAEEKAG